VSDTLKSGLVEICGCKSFSEVEVGIKQNKNSFTDKKKKPKGGKRQDSTEINRHDLTQKTRKIGSDEA
jgi:hypothetical protein